MKRFIFGFLLICAFSVVLYGSYKLLNPKTYKIRFNSNGGSKIATILIKENNLLATLPIPTKENYVFKGWYEGKFPFDNTKKITKDYTLEALWEEKELESYNIYFDTLGGSTIPSIKIKNNEIIKDLPIPIKEGYTFEAWTYQNNIINEITGTKNMTLVAKYKLN